MSKTKHTVTTPDGVVHTRTSANRVYAVAIVATTDPVAHNLWLAKTKRRENEYAAKQIAEYEASLAKAPDERQEIRDAEGRYKTTLFSKTDYTGWIRSCRDGIATREQEIALAEARAADPATKPTYWVQGWSQTIAQGHKTARSDQNRWGTAQGTTLSVVTASHS